MSDLPTMRVEALGITIDLTLPEEPGFVRDLGDAWSRCVVSQDGPPVARLELRLETDPDVPLPHPDPEAGLVVARSLPELAELVTQHVTYRAISARAGQMVMLHACAVADPETGRVVAFAGPSGMGKTTLAQRWSREWSYVTDETVAIDETGRVWPYPKPLSVIAGEGAKVQRGPDEAGLRPLGDGELFLGRVVLLDRDPQRPARVEVEPLETVDGVAFLVEHTSFLTRLTRPLARLAAACTSRGPVLGLRYRDHEDLGPLVRDLLSDR